MTKETKGIGRIQLSLEVVRIRADGSHEEPREAECNSWLKQWAEIFSTMFETAAAAGATTSSVLDTGGSGQTVETAAPGNSSEGPRANSGAADETFGIQLGTGTTSIDRDDNALVTLIADGSSSTQLDYLATTFSARVAISGGYRFTISRQVNNNSGGTITVKEIGLALLHRISGPGTAKFLCLRDLVTEAIPTGESRIFRYHLDFIA